MDKKLSKLYKKMYIDNLCTKLCGFSFKKIDFSIK